MAYQDTELVFLFFFYSFTGWVLETTIASISFKTFKNRGFLSGSFCLMYGLIGVAVSITFKDLRGSVVLLFLGCFLMTVLIQWITAIFLEWIGHGKWWNYSHSFLHLNAYISVPIAAALGAVGVMAVLFINDLMIGFFRLIPEWLTNLFLLSLIALTAFDLVISFITVHCRGKQKNKIAGWNRILSGTTGMLGKRISTFMIKRLEKAYPELCREADQDTGQDAAEGIPDQKAPAIPSAAWRLSFFDYFWFFVAGALIGDFVETIFMWLVYGKWMSRSSLVWGSFSIVWGVAMVLCFLLIGRGGRHSDAFCFISGTLFGGTFEYFCSIFSELVLEPGRIDHK